MRQIQLEAMGVQFSVKKSELFSRGEVMFVIPPSSTYACAIKFLRDGAFKWDKRNYATAKKNESRKAKLENSRQKQAVSLHKKPLGMRFVVKSVFIDEDFFWSR